MFLQSVDVSRVPDIVKETGRVLQWDRDILKCFFLDLLAVSSMDLQALLSVVKPL